MATHRPDCADVGRGAGVLERLVQGVGGTLSVGAPQPLFAIAEFFGWTYAVAPDGERFLVREPLAEADASPLTVLTAWRGLLAPG